jgi:hypothetical protein
MISLKILSTAAAMALVLPMVVPSESFAQNPPAGRSAGRAAVGPSGGGGRSFSGGGAVRNYGGGGAVRNYGGGGAPVARFNGGGRGGAPTAQYSGGGGRYAGGGGGYYRRGGNGFVPGAVAGALIGGAIASQSYGYYDGGPAYAPGYYDDQSQYYDDGGVVAVAPGGGGDDAVAYCTQTYRSYDPGSGTYLGFDGLRHPCP